MITVLSLTLVVMTIISIEHISTAQGDPNLTCQDISCGSQAQCGEAGTVISSCKIRCYSGSTIQCTGSGGGGNSNTCEGGICPELPTNP